ncbi:hypothetical protein BX600DRAFT_508484 [Xylariales sp. PMI_506]|nr:hypothetical protein BX600DRAFT_508484 [Xylariales sp. PMI_506]
MSDEAAAPVDQKAPATTGASAPADASAPAPTTDLETGDAQPPVAASEDKPDAAEDSTKTTAEKPATDADVEMKDLPTTSDSKDSESASKVETSKSDEQPAADDDAKAAEEQPAQEEAPADSAAPAADTTATPSSSSKARRKSGASEPKGKKLNKKASKAKMTHLDAKPGDHFFARLKGYPPWPVIICDEDMLPQNMLSSRPVSAARPDGDYREDFADGGKRAGDRSYAVMYLQTNEFSWIRNTDLEDLDPSLVKDLVTPKMRKDLAQAHSLASEKNDIDYYKQVLREFQEAKIADAEAKAARARAKKEKGNKKAEPQEEDVEMADADAAEDEESDSKKVATKKRKAEDDASTPQRSDSVKKPKIKLTSSATPKASANGVQSPSIKESTSKAAKPKTKASKPAKDAEAKKEAAPKEPEMTPEERHIRKEKEILFLRHRLQKGLLNRESEPKEEEMKIMSDYLTKLEGFPDLEVSIIRATKINKVLKAILKLSSIPKEEDFRFKPRSQTLLDKWTKILATEPAPAPGGDSAPANGVNGDAAISKEPKASVESGEGAANTPKESDKEGDASVTEGGKEKDGAKVETDSKTVTENNAKSTEEAPAATEATA